MHEFSIGITVGDPAGIGPEIVFKALEYFSHYKKYSKIKFYCLCTEEIFSAHILSDFNARWNTIRNSLNLVLLEPEVFSPSNRLSYIPGQISREGGLFAYKSFMTLLDICKEKNLNAIVTAPLNKQSLKLAGIPYVDHTTMMEHYFGCTIDTMFKVKNLKVYFFTKHIPLMQLPQYLKPEKLLQFIQRCYQYEKNLSNTSSKPLALAAINPHASDGGKFGKEEISILEPICQKAQSMGIPIVGPLSADSVYYQALKGKYSAVLSLYHDQGHIATKMVDFYRTVSFSLGASVLRTSVDHGTAMDITGQEKASPISFISAVNEALRFGYKYKKIATHMM